MKVTRILAIFGLLFVNACGVEQDSASETSGVAVNSGHRIATLNGVNCADPRSAVLSFNRCSVINPTSGAFKFKPVQLPGATTFNGNQGNAKLENNGRCLTRRPNINGKIDENLDMQQCVILPQFQEDLHRRQIWFVNFAGSPTNFFAFNAAPGTAVGFIGNKKFGPLDSFGRLVLKPLVQNNDQVRAL